MLIVLLAGSYLTYVFEGFGLDIFSRWIGFLSWEGLRILLLLPLLFVVAQILRKIQIRFSKKKDQESFFISDQEGKNKDEDGFGFISQAEQFADKVFNQGSSESLVFGIDAPWGTGKSTFVNLCKEYWDEKYKKEMIIYKFDPLRYENQDNLLERFINGLEREINNHTFAPEIGSLISKYEKYLKDPKASFSLFGLSFDIPLAGDSLEDIFERLESVLLTLDRKIIIIIDDLDRLSFESIKEVLFVIKKSFTLPNLSYVLCYDTENISALEKDSIDTGKISEFLEKFVNVKTSIFLDNDKLSKFFTENKTNSLARNRLADTRLVSIVSEGLKDIFQAKDFHHYRPFIGDARKIKRLMNTAVLLGLEKMDFKYSDIDKHDLVILLLIYVNYPNIFRKIHDTETQGKNGFFSTIYEYEGPGQGKYKNSDEYEKYLADLSSEDKKFILNKVFGVKEKLKVSDKGIRSGEITREMETSYACFNGSYWNSRGRNLEKYVNLITKMISLEKTEQYKFYLQEKDKILLEGDIVDVFAQDEYANTRSEKTHEQLWTVLINSPNQEYKVEKSIEVINYAIQILPNHSLLEIESIDVGFRSTLVFIIAKLLDQVGWTDEEGKHSSRNTTENVTKIADWIFGENDHEGNSVLEILGEESRGIMGFHDLILFRLRCCSDRGGDIYNLSRALSKHGDQNAPTEGNTKDILVEEMREISQKVFSIFKTSFIDKGINIFDEIDKLTLDDACGNYSNYVGQKVESGSVDNINYRLSALKSGMKSFIIYQLGNYVINLGIGCGYYDISGKNDGKAINMAVNDYLFDRCFNPEINQNNHMHFLDYLLINLSHTFGHSRETKYIPNINEFTKVLDRERLTVYWEKNRNAIKAKNYDTNERQVITFNYTASYNEDLEGVYKVLDELIIEITP
ncbi:MAG: P-loop NTPase fold protein [Candidatus Altimarinota bacterium]